MARSKSTPYPTPALQVAFVPPVRVHCRNCINFGFDCVSQTRAESNDSNDRASACVRCARKKKGCDELPAIAHLAYAAWTRSSDADEPKAAKTLQRVLKSAKSLKRLEKDNVFPRVILDCLQQTVDRDAKLLILEPGGVPAMYVLGPRRQAVNPKTERPARIKPAGAANAEGSHATSGKSPRKPPAGNAQREQEDSDSETSSLSDPPED